MLPQPKIQAVTAIDSMTAPEDPYIVQIRAFETSFSTS
jgi:hypothetical protein